MRLRRHKDAAAALPLGALLIFTPPFMLAFDHPGRFMGVPLLLIFLFVLWTVGIGLAWALGRRLVAEIDEDLATDEAEQQPQLGP